jgi:CHD5-like protein
MLTTGLQFAVGWWYSRSAVFYLPTAWLGPFTWWLSLLFAPAGKSYHFDVMAPSDPDVSGSVSCGVWQMACRRVIKVGERVVKEFISQLPCYDLTRIVIELRCPDSDQEQGTSDKNRDGSTDTPKSHTTPQKS